MVDVSIQGANPKGRKNSGCFAKDQELDLMKPIGCSQQSHVCLVLKLMSF